ncbi:MAG: ATP-binding protein [Bifidobacteriaceae bacterium]|jgi:hypothetical protein|nr:ATP-binding protein [Bifidobacteriaceae bacterium]
MVTNPFKPTAGATPPVLVGRQEAIEQFAESLDNGPGAPGLLTRFTGSRGTGKTVMLTAFRREAEARGWTTLSETATPGLVARLAEAAAREARRLKPRSRRRRDVVSITLPQAFGVGGGGVSFAPTPVQAVDLREQLGLLADLAGKRQAGLLITVDEVHSVARDDLRALSTVFQHLVTEDRPVGLALAGLPAAVSDTLNDAVMTFLRRAVAVELGEVTRQQVKLAFEDQAKATGVAFETGLLDQAADATEGYPFMIQLVGYHVWRQAEAGRIGQRQLEAGISAAREQLGASVLAAALGDLSPGDRAYLAAMAVDDGPSSTGEIAVRLGRTPSAAGQYRLRLIAAGVIEPAGHGLADIALPYLRDFLRSGR